MGLLGIPFIPDWLVNYDYFDQDANISLEDILISSVYSIVLGVLIIIYFALKRYGNPNYFSVRGGPKPPTLPLGPFSWLHSLLSIPETEFLSCAGYDALVNIRMYVLALKISVCLMIFGLCVILPINLSGGGYKDSEANINSFSRCSIANIEEGSHWLWVHVIGIVVLTMLSFRFLIEEFKVYTRLRHMHLKQVAPHVRTIMLSSVPHAMRVGSTLHMYFSTLYPDSVVAVTTTLKLPELSKALDERQDVLARLERAIMRKEDPKAGTGPWRCSYKSSCLGAGEIDTTIDDLAERLSTLNARVAALQAEVAQRKAATNKSPTTRTVRLGSQGLNPSIGKELSQKLLLDDYQRGPLEGYLSNHGVLYEEEHEQQQEKDVFQSVPEGTILEPSPAPPRGGRRTLSRLGSWLTGSNAVRQGEGLHTLLPSDSENLKALKASASAPLAPWAFVTFRTYSAATIAQQVHHSSQLGRLDASIAPEPRDLIWSSAHLSQGKVRRRKIIVKLLLILLCLFWVIPVTLVAMLLSPESLRGSIPWVGDLCARSPAFEALIDQVQPLALLALMSALPPIVKYLTLSEGPITYSSVQMLGAARLFSFEVVNVFFVTLIANVSFDSLALVLHDLSSALTLLGETMPQVAGFFCQYMLIKLLVGLPMELGRIPALLEHYVRKLVVREDTPRDKTTSFIGLPPYEHPGPINYLKNVAQDLMMVLITLAFAMVNPLILPVSTAYFSCAYIVYKHQHLYVYEPAYESGGSMFPIIFRRFIFCIIVGQAILAGVLLLKQGFYQATACLILLFLTIAFNRRMRASHEKWGASLPLEMATLVDMASQDEGMSPSNFIGLDQFLQPELKAPVHVKPDLNMQRQHTYTSSQGGDYEGYYTPKTGGKGSREGVSMQTAFC